MKVFAKILSFVFSYVLLSVPLTAKPDKILSLNGTLSDLKNYPDICTLEDFRLEKIQEYNEEILELKKKIEEFEEAISLYYDYSSAMFLFSHLARESLLFLNDNDDPEIITIILYSLSSMTTIF